MNVRGGSAAGARGRAKDRAIKTARGSAIFKPGSGNTAPRRRLRGYVCKVSIKPKALHDGHGPLIFVDLVSDSDEWQCLSTQYAALPVIR